LKSLSKDFLRPLENFLGHFDTWYLVIVGAINSTAAPRLIAWKRPN
jgi:hypothetical protein